MNASAKLVIPGLIDTNVQLAQAWSEAALMTWSRYHGCVSTSGCYRVTTTRKMALSALACNAEMLKSSTPTFLESMLAHWYGFDETVQESGIRACLVAIVIGIGTYATQHNSMHPGMCEDRETSLLGALVMLNKWQGTTNGRIHIWVGPRTLGGITSKLYCEMSELARQKNMGITMHLAEVKADKIYLQKKFGLSPVLYTERLGLLEPGLVLVQIVWLNDADIARLTKTGTHVSHNPSSNSKLFSGVCKVPQLLKRGANVTPGCNGGPSNNDDDMIREIKLAAVIHKAVSIHPLTKPAEAVLELATINGARTPGLEHEVIAQVNEQAYQVYQRAGIDIRLK